MLTAGYKLVPGFVVNPLTPPKVEIATTFREPGRGVTNGRGTLPAQLDFETDFSPLSITLSSNVPALATVLVSAWPAPRT